MKANRPAALAAATWLVLLGLVLGACTAPVAAPSQPGESAQAPAGEKPTIRFAYNWTGGDAKAKPYEGALNKYIEENKDKVNIQLEATPGDEHRNKVKVDLAADNIADVMVYWTGEPTLRPFIDSNQIVDMDTVLQSSTATQRSQWTDASLASSMLDDKLWTLPVEAFRCFFLYNKPLFDDKGLVPPTTYAGTQADR